jgi:hypothetical protein
MSNFTFNRVLMSTRTRPKNQIITKSSDQLEILDVFFKDLQTKSKSFEIIGSGWTLQNIQYIQINISDYRPLRGSGGSSFITKPILFSLGLNEFITEF